MTDDLLLLKLDGIKDDVASTREDVVTLKEHVVGTPRAPGLVTRMSLAEAKLRSVPPGKRNGTTKALIGGAVAIVVALIGVAAAIL